MPHLKYWKLPHGTITVLGHWYVTSRLGHVTTNVIITGHHRSDVRQLVLRILWFRADQENLAVAKRESASTWNTVKTNQDNKQKESVRVCRKLNISLDLAFTLWRVCIAQTMLSQDVRLFVHLSHAGIESKRLYISSTFFHCRVAPPF